MTKRWAISFGEPERIELERIMTDQDFQAALAFLRQVVYPKVKESEKPHGCYHDSTKPVDELPRPIKKHKWMGSGRME